ncbi:MAG: hypothetical protein JWN37_684 [Candidatus Nomurabacteria bacterium]|nr:hypothetical protein [Candidatus Nomurabacteria bacterium]
MLDLISQLNPFYFYPAFCILLIFLGGAVLLPVMYLSILGSLNIYYLFIAVLISAILADAIWYFIRLHYGKDKLYKWSFIKNRVSEAERFSKFYEKHGIKMVFLAKFVYGTRIASQLLAGIHKLNFWKFQGAILAGAAIWFWVFYFLLKGLHLGVASIKSTAVKIQIIALVVILLIILINWFTNKYIKSKWMK